MFSRTLVAMLFVVAAGPAIAKEPKLDNDDKNFLGQLSTYCAAGPANSFADETRSDDQKRDLGKKIISNFLIFRQRHPTLAAKFNGCIGDTWEELKARHLDDFVDH